MNADVLVNLLLELNVLNVQDIDRELKKLAANVEDPRAQKWLIRVARHFIVNIDQLLAQPYRAKAEPRGHNSSKYRYEPTGGWNAGQAPAEPPPEGKSKWWGEQPYAGDPAACSTCGGSGFIRSVEPVGGGPARTTPWTTHDPENVRLKCPTCKGTGKRVYTKSQNKREGFFPESRTIFEVSRKKKAPEEVYEPDPAGVYTSRLHAPGVQKDIEQNYMPYSTKKAPKSGAFGGPPAAEKVEPWVKEREKEQELHHFDPIQVRKRELWLRLENFVNYANWMSSTLAKKNSEKPEDQQKAKNAELFFRRLETMHTGDIDGFRAVMREAVDFKTDVETRPWIYMDDPKLVAEHGAYTLLRVVLWQTAINLSERKTSTGGEPSWCTNMETHAKSYTRQGPLFFCDKNGYPYVLVHFESTQAKNLTDVEIDATIAAEIAPLFIDPKRFPIDKFQSANRFGGGGIVNLGKAVAALRTAQGIRG